MPLKKSSLFRLLLILLGIILLSTTPNRAAAEDIRITAVHVVQWGETIPTIAADYEVSAETILSANNLTLASRLNAGERLLIPGGAPAPAPSAQTTHVVQSGEGLYRIGLRYGLTIAELMAANNISNPNSIYVGQVLIIPAPGTVNTAPPAAVTPPASGGIHVVQAGETLFRISQRYGVSVQALTSANGLLNPSSIYPGQRLVIPGVDTPPVDTPPPAGTTPNTGTHVVRIGETLGIIAARYGVSMASIAQANRLRNPSLLYVGQTLIIPGGGTASGPATQEPSTPPASSGSTHTVLAGETLSRIALNYGVLLSDLMALNGIANANAIYTGQVLSIPAGGAPQSSSPPTQPSGPAPAATQATAKQIIVVLSQQAVYAYESGQLVRSFVVSTGLPATPTVQGDYSIYLKYDAQRMVGPDYDLPGVPWVMYFYRGYGFHGTYWHNNFGNPMSHGCVNMRTEEALWLYQWAPVGTAVRVIWA